MMQKLNVQKTSLAGLMVVEPFLATDERGYFSKYFERRILEENGINLDVYECCESKSSKGVLRGLHFQSRHWQDKLVRCLSGKLFDVAVDLRKDSPTFGQWEGFYLTPANRKALYVPVGFAHGFISLEDDTVLSYLCGDRYDPESDGGVRWNDPDIAVDWPLEGLKQVTVSDKDGKLPFLKDVSLI